jgi:F-type H+-transporting ATPase subunit b
MCAVFLLSQPESGGQVEQIARTFGVDWSHLVAQTISFGIVCALLYWLAYRPILRMLDQRREQIAQGLANAQKIAAELAKTEAQRRDVLVAAHAEAKALIEEARTAAARVQAEESGKAVAAAQEILARAHEAAAQERAQLLAALRRDMGRLVLQTTATVTGKVLTAEDHRRLAEETARQLTAES